MTREGRFLYTGFLKLVHFLILEFGTELESAFDFHLQIEIR